MPMWFEPFVSSILIFFAHSPMLYKCVYTYIYNYTHTHTHIKYLHIQDYFHKLNGMLSIVTTTQNAVYPPSSPFPILTCLGESTNFWRSRSSFSCEFSDLLRDCVSYLPLWNTNVDESLLYFFSSLSIIKMCCFNLFFIPRPRTFLGIYLLL